MAMSLWLLLAVVEAFVLMYGHIKGWPAEVQAALAALFVLLFGVFLIALICPESFRATSTAIRHLTS